MRRKRQIVLVSVLLFIVLVIVLSSAIFSLKTISIVFYDNNDILITDNSNLVNFEEDKFSDIINNAQFKMGSSVFFINKQKHMDKLENAYPYIKIINIETIFPNKLRIKAIERQEFFTLQVGTKYAILDGELKVLKIVESLSGYEQLIKLSGVNVSVAVEGQFLNDGINSYLSNLKNYLKISNYNYEGSIDVFSEIKLLKETDSLGDEIYSIKFYTIYENDAGLTIYIQNIKNNLENKVFKAINVYDDILSPEPPFLEMTPREGQIRVLDNLTTYYTIEGEDILV